MTQKDQIKSYIINSKIINKRWGSVADKTENAINWISENSSYKSMAKILNELYFETVQSGKEVDRHKIYYYKFNCNIKTVKCSIK